MDNIYNDLEYMNIVFDILNNDKFVQIKECKHHGMTRLEHSLRVSYYSYIVAKKLKLNYTATARGGLLHDFFLKEDLTKKEQKISAIVHPYIALQNSCETFAISDLEKDIIINHMFPTLPHKVPKYLESWLVSLIDKLVAAYEFYFSYGKSYIYKLSNLYIILLLLR